MGVVQESPSIGATELATISNRVVNCLSRSQNISPNEREIIFQKAAQFVEMAEGGDRIIQTGYLSLNASSNLRSYGWITRGYASARNTSGLPPADQMRQELQELRMRLLALGKGEPIGEDKRKEVKELFAFLKRIALSVDIRPTDKVVIGSFAF